MSPYWKDALEAAVKALRQTGELVTLDGVYARMPAQGPQGESAPRRDVVLVEMWRCEEPHLFQGKLHDPERPRGSPLKWVVANRRQRLSEAGPSEPRKPSPSLLRPAELQAQREQAEAHQEEAEENRQEMARRSKASQEKAARSAKALVQALPRPGPGPAHGPTVAQNPTTARVIAAQAAAAAEAKAEAERLEANQHLEQDRRGLFMALRE